MIVNFVLLPERFVEDHLPLRHPIEWDSPKSYPFTVLIPMGRLRVQLLRLPKHLLRTSHSIFTCCTFNHIIAGLSIGNVKKSLFARKDGDLHTANLDILTMR